MDAARPIAAGIGTVAPQAVVARGEVVHPLTLTTDTRIGRANVVVVAIRIRNALCLGSSNASPRRAALIAYGQGIAIVAGRTDRLGRMDTRPAAAVITSALVAIIETRCAVGQSVGQAYAATAARVGIIAQAAGRASAC